MPNSYDRMPRKYSKDWCQGFCGKCGTSCADHCEDQHELRTQLAETAERVSQLEKQIELLKGSLIKTPDELHAISAGVEEWGFGKRRQANVDSSPATVNHEQVIASLSSPSTQTQRECGEQAGWCYRQDCVTCQRAGAQQECRDCGKATKPGPGAARCPECWEDRCGHGETAQQEDQPLGAKLHSTMDAEVWTKEFMRLWGSALNAPIDHDLMRSWFANAIMCGWDIAHQRMAEKKGELAQHAPIPNCAAPSTRDGQVAPVESRLPAGGNPVSTEFTESAHSPGSSGRKE